jgi:hypothetical protein
MTILKSSALAQGEIELLGNNLTDAVHDRSLERQRHCRRVAKEIEAYLAATWWAEHDVICKGSMKIYRDDPNACRA